MSRRTRTVVSTLKKLFAPKVISCNRVSQSMRKKRQQNVYYDKSAKTQGTRKVKPYEFKVLKDLINWAL